MTSAAGSYFLNYQQHILSLVFEKGIDQIWRSLLAEACGYLWYWQGASCWYWAGALSWYWSGRPGLCGTSQLLLYRCCCWLHPLLYPAPLSETQPTYLWAPLSLESLLFTTTHSFLPSHTPFYRRVSPRNSFPNHAFKRLTRVYSLQATTFVENSRENLNSGEKCQTVVYFKIFNTLLHFNNHIAINIVVSDRCLI